MWVVRSRGDPSVPSLLGGSVVSGLLWSLVLLRAIVFGFCQSRYQLPMRRAGLGHHPGRAGWSGDRSDTSHPGDRIPQSATRESGCCSDVGTDETDCANGHRVSSGGVRRPVGADDAPGNGNDGPDPSWLFRRMMTCREETNRSGSAAWTLGLPWSTCSMWRRRSGHDFGGSSFADLSRPVMGCSWFPATRSTRCSCDLPSMCCSCPRRAS